MLHEHQDAKLLGRKNRDKGFAMLLAHLDGAYKALHRYSNRAAVSPVGRRNLRPLTQRTSDG